MFRPSYLRLPPGTSVHGDWGCADIIIKIQAILITLVACEISSIYTQCSSMLSHPTLLHSQFHLPKTI